MKDSDTIAMADGTPLPLGDTKGRIRVSDVGDVDEQAANITAWYQEYDQLGAGKFFGSITEVWLGQMQFFLETTSHALRQTCVVWPGAFWFGLPRCDSADGLVNASPLDRNAIAVRPGGADFELLTPEDYQILGVVIDETLLERHAHVAERPDLLDLLRKGESFPLLARQKAWFWQRVSHTLLEAASLGQQRLPDTVCDTLVEELMTGLFELFDDHIAPVKLRHSNLSYRRLVSGARDYVLSQPDQLFSVTDLCEQLHVSRRTLQNAFHSVLGICPVSYLKALRLNAVRRTLRNHESGFSTVQDVAALWGFWHMSQFAADYFAMFSEHPSETLKAGGGDGMCFRYPSGERSRAGHGPRPLNT
ncbi:helix-turn-helix domain-containing protein [Pseudothauera nasutitermitis]|uniref:Helix-turn-helix domain-containing protein n=1 Tax=Pseudothauera nasutitermitis TaxID=2565930 RepID=A0A4S4B2Z6_9RHOO|nr:helix-turn-helix domain-containing protein [Pseudothauera nasutitermitis]THF67018.1 helix-turn-helix domain-containing protein [Pseudothauera nasutitermitis]